LREGGKFGRAPEAVVVARAWPARTAGMARDSCHEFSLQRKKILDSSRGRIRAESRRSSRWRSWRLVVSPVHQIIPTTIRANIPSQIVRVVARQAARNRHVMKES
jgi:hypothetical protein